MAQLAYPRLDDENNIPAVLTAGKQIINSQKNSRLQNISANGRTLIDILGGAGNGESLTGLSGIAEISTTQKKSGNSSFKFVATAGNKYLHKDYDYPIDSSKQYILGGWVFLESFSAGYISFGLRQKGTMTVVAESTVMDTSKIGSWQFVHAKVPLGSVFSGSGFRLLFGPASGSAVMTVYFDDVRLYAVSATDYAAIGTTITGDDIDNLLPYTSGIKGVEGLYAKRWGKNLALPLIASNYDVSTGFPTPPIFDGNSVTLPETDSAVGYIFSKEDIPSLGIVTYTMSAVANGSNKFLVRLKASNGGSYTSVDTEYMSGFKYNSFYSAFLRTTSATSVTFTVPSHIPLVQIGIASQPTGMGSLTVSKLQLEMSSSLSPYSPREDNIIAFSDLELHSNAADGSDPDTLREVNGRYEVTKLWRKMMLDGLLPWKHNYNLTGYKSLLLPKFSANYSGNLILGFVTKFNGQSLINTGDPVATTGTDKFRQRPEDSYFYINVSNTDTGWGDSYTPSEDEIKAYFNGYQMGSVSGGVFTTPYVSGTKSWRYVTGDNSAGTTTLPTTLNPGNAGWQPYQLLYRLAAATIETTQEDGSLSLIEGNNLVEVGSGYVSRERVNPASSATAGDSSYQINDTYWNSQLKNKLKSFVNVYKNNMIDPNWIKLNYGTTYGLERATTPESNFDVTAAYTVSYIKLDASPVVGISGMLVSTEKGQIRDLTEGVTEAISRISVVEAKKANTDAPMWIKPTMINGWVNYHETAWETAGYYKDASGVVRLKGLIASGAIPSTCFMLPKGYRPKQAKIFIGIADDNVNRIDVFSSGEVYIQLRGSSWVSLETVSFLAEQ